MQTAEALFIVLGMLLTGYAALMTFFSLAQILMKKELSISSIFKDFRQKIWMTASLGLFFFGLYIMIIFLSTVSIDLPTRLTFFSSLYNNPVRAIYIGLFIFISVSISICLVRAVIKHLYNARYK